LGYEADAYFSRTKLIDLEKYNIQDGGAAFDTFAEASLMGTQAGLELPNLIPSFNDSRWTKHANAVVSGDSKTLTLNATAAWQNSYVEIPILPNNRYEVMWEETHSVNSSVLQIDEKYNNITIKSASTQVLNGTSSTFTVGPNTNKIRVYISSNAIGAFSFSNLSLKLKM
jgi:hypothetical protein